MIKANTNIEEILRDKIIKLALLQLNKKYEHFAQGPDTFDCAGLVYYVYEEVLGIDIFKDGYGLSTTTMLMTSPIGELTLIDKYSQDKDFSYILPGDILLFHTQSKDDNEPKEDNYYPGHAAIYLGDKEFIQCTSRKDRGVMITSLNKKSHYNKIVASKNMFKNNKTFNK